MTTTEHPAKFSAPIIAEIRRMLDLYAPLGGTVLDPFAGVGGIHDLRDAYDTVGVELEPEWANESAFTLVGSALDLRRTFGYCYFDAFATSPCYGNRMADHHEAKDSSKRYTYRHMLGRMPSEESAAVMQWGAEYKRFHSLAWLQVYDVLKPGAPGIVNISDHVRKGAVQKVSDWHFRTLQSIGFELVEWTEVKTKRMRNGANAKLRVDHENVICLRKPDPFDC